MVVIADHHKSWKDTEHELVCEWPETCYVQWGSCGLVTGKNPYTTAFFEAFGKDGITGTGFVRGEGETVAEAERDCHRQYYIAAACNHDIGRKGYTNGGGICHKCGAFESKHFKPVVKLGEWRKPLPWHATIDPKFHAISLERWRHHPDMMRFLRTKEIKISLGMIEPTPTEFEHRRNVLNGGCGI